MQNNTVTAQQQILAAYELLKSCNVNATYSTFEYSGVTFEGNATRACLAYAKLDTTDTFYIYLVKTYKLV